ncbi:LPO_1073/Vpar_1526 family protein [Vibrio parahaemolyticus]|uniref:LPO_1073/Vpar_1526 family protein n=1 Tax=Vibrio parahaemolyticus TaxID=670 RepID=UPI001E413169|nr:LPO_1073/Vpar_1526 family protein [Vibrio parahaemolyticus]
MINDKHLEQVSGNNSENYQAEKIVVHKQGLSYSDCKEVALDVYKSNYLQLSSDAAALAYQRAEHLLDQLLIKLKENQQESLAAFQDPGMQTAIYDAQKAFVRSGDEDLEAVLVDLLQERFNSEERDLKQIILDQALNVASMLTSQQMDILSLVFIFTQTKRNGLGTLEEFYQYLESTIAPLTSELTGSELCYQHLKFSGCCSLYETSTIKPIEELIRSSYPAFFSKGFELSDINLEEARVEKVKPLFLQCFHYPNLLQFNALNADDLKTKCTGVGLNEDEVRIIVQLFNSTTMSTQEIKQHLSDKFDYMEELLSKWVATSLNKVSMSTVGIAIAQINYRIKTGNSLDIGVWLDP